MENLISTFVLRFLVHISMLSDLIKIIVKNLREDKCKHMLLSYNKM